MGHPVTISDSKTKDIPSGFPQQLILQGLGDTLRWKFIRENKKVKQK